MTIELQVEMLHYTVVQMQVGGELLYQKFGNFYSHYTWYV